MLGLLGIRIFYKVRREFSGLVDRERVSTFAKFVRSRQGIICSCIFLLESRTSNKFTYKLVLLENITIDTYLSEIRFNTALANSRKD